MGLSVNYNVTEGDRKQVGIQQTHNEHA